MAGKCHCVWWIWVICTFFVVAAADKSKVCNPASFCEDDPSVEIVSCSGVYKCINNKKECLKGWKGAACQTSTLHPILHMVNACPNEGLQECHYGGTCFQRTCCCPDGRDPKSYCKHKRKDVCSPGKCGKRSCHAVKVGKGFDYSCKLPDELLPSWRGQIMVKPTINSERTMVEFTPWKPPDPKSGTVPVTPSHYLVQYSLDDGKWVQGAKVPYVQTSDLQKTFVYCLTRGKLDKYKFRVVPTVGVQQRKYIHLDEKKKDEKETNSDVKNDKKTLPKKSKSNKGGKKKKKKKQEGNQNGQKVVPDNTDVPLPIKGVTGKKVVADNTDAPLPIKVDTGAKRVVADNTDDALLLKVDTGYNRAVGSDTDALLAGNVVIGSNDEDSGGIRNMGRVCTGIFLTVTAIVIAW